MSKLNKAFYLYGFLYVLLVPLLNRFSWYYTLAATVALGVISVYIFVKTVKYNWEPRYRNLNILFVLVLQTVVFIYVRIL